MIYLDNAATSFPKAPGVSAVMSSVINKGCFNIGRGGYSAAYDLSERVFDARDRLAELFDVPSGKNIIFTSGITASLNMAMKGLLRSGDHAVTTSMEHNSVLRPLKQLEAGGVELTILPCDKNGGLEPGDVAEAIKPNTRAVITTHASNVCGTLLPVQEIGKICREKGVMYIADTAQTAGLIPISMAGDFIDVVAFTGHKSLLGPQGIGGMAITDEAAETMEPLITGGTGSFSNLLEAPGRLPDRFEAGTLNIPGILGLSEAVGYLTETGIGTILERERGVYAYTAGRLRKMPGVRIIADIPPEGKCPVLALDFPDRDCGEISAALDRDFGIMTRCGLHCAPLAHRTLGTYPGGVVRVSFGHKSGNGDGDALVSALETILKAGM